MHGSRRLETGRIELRHLSPDDAPVLFRAVGDPEVMRYWAPGPDRDVHQTAARIAEIDDHWRTYGFGDWAVGTRPGGEVIGFAGLHYIAEMAEVNLGYALEKARWRQGLGREVCELVLAYGFRELDLPEIVAVIDPRNTRSITLAERCGLMYRKRFAWTGRDRVAYSISREAWEGPRAG